MATSCATAQLEVRDSGVLLLLDGTESSWIDLHDPTHLDFEYQQQMDAIVSALRGPTAPVHAVHLGGAGCALARAWDASRPGSTQLAVEIDAILARQVREWFELPRAPRLRIRVGDAAQVVHRLHEGEWDVVVRDVFAAGVVPQACMSREFLAACRRSLSEGGLYLANTTCPPRQAVAAELAHMRELFGGVLVVADPAVVRGRRRGNLVIVARAEPWTPTEADEVERAVRRLPLPVRTWRADDPALPRPATNR
ncbi:fused MFS/spermidine synthase [Actinomyces sp. MRS3W]|uniref:spermidine synthase n=1 Tax=Actinomyces sp. MRS3W TaxID=2800796 RepID=UPI0028FD6293|nr:fused MFS/spermidine synthase [Actinomyces sp. MRS3W]MDU0347498.1 fused MFS/spermidine synthase [Actinomyces sp. MRS3W]